MVLESEKIGIFGHGFTYGGHPVSCSVALETLKIYEDIDIIAQVKNVSPILQAGLKRFSDHSLVGEVRGVGLLGALELVRDKRNKDPFDLVQGVGQYLVKRCQENGLITRALGDTLAFSPPLIINKNEISRMLNIVEISLDETAAWIDQIPSPI